VGGGGSTSDPHANDAEQDVEEEVEAAASLDEDRQRRQQDAQDEQKDVAHRHSRLSVYHRFFWLVLRCCVCVWYRVLCGVFALRVEKAYLRAVGVPNIRRNRVRVLQGGLYR
jgi:Flp pilus assembly protein TadB